MVRHAVLLGCVMVLCFAVSAARAQDPATESGTAGPVTEEPDATRLDAERLPPEAIEVTRELYAHGLYVESRLGARGFLGSLGEIAPVGPYFAVDVGYELFSWLSFGGRAEASMHRTAGPRPPRPRSFQLYGFLAELRLNINAGARAALFLSFEGGLSFVPTDDLQVYGFRDAKDLGLIYGGELGFDWHMKNRHSSLGLAGGARLLPNLQRAGGQPTMGIHGAAYFRHVF
ncbi:MAG: hypothetical protein GXP55_09860 [Deltaproteobacteria bacterium]|nr:hypothetical protein [Deltaproteobacteria bacterium]